MTPSQIEAARALVASPHFRWMPGMRAVDQNRTTYRVVIAGDAYEDSRGTAKWINVDDGGDYLPDLDDPATRSCLLEIAREAWDEPRAHTVPSLHSAIWFFYDGEGCGPLGIAPSEGEAISAAILAAPVQP